MSETLYCVLIMYFFKLQPFNFHASPNGCIVFILTEQWSVSLDRNQGVMESAF